MNCRNCGDHIELITGTGMWLSLKRARAVADGYWCPVSTNHHHVPVIRPITYNPDGTIRDGHARAAAMQRLGSETLEQEQDRIEAARAEAEASPFLIRPVIGPLCEAADWEADCEHGIPGDESCWTILEEGGFI
jgi:hypothetical protein